MPFSCNSSYRTSSLAVFRILDVPQEESKLLPRVLATSGKTLIVSSAGNVTTMLEQNRRRARSIGDAVSESTPKVNLAKFRLIED
jgi:hypothetical protein